MNGQRVKGFAKGNTRAIMSGLRLHGPDRSTAVTRAWNESLERYGIPRSGRLPAGYRVKRYRGVVVVR